MKTVKKLMGRAATSDGRGVLPSIPRKVPILFSAPMVRAILAGKKTRTRRILNGGGPDFHSRARLLDFKNGVATFGDSIPDDPVPVTIKARWNVGDTLWVRETFGYVTGNGKRVVYRADGDPPPPVLGTPEVNGVQKMTWKPSIFMRPAESRITLEVTGVRVERLQAITSSEIRAEGIDEKTVADLLHKPRVEDTPLRDLWRLGWDAINGKTMPWSLSPFVWVLEFARIS